MEPKEKYRLHATRVDRIAVVDRGAVPDAEILLFKRFNGDDDETIEKGTTSFQNLSLADRNRVWDAGEAQKRIVKWAGGPDKEKINWTKLRKAYMWFNSANPELLGSYKLPYADVIDGALKAVPRAIIAIVQRIKGTQIPLADKKKVLNHCRKYYAKMDMEFPEIVLKSIATVDFNAEFVIKATEAAVDVLESGFWGPLRFQSEFSASERNELWKELFEDFRSMVLKVLKNITKKTKANSDVQEVKLTTKEIVNSFSRVMKAVAISESFRIFRSHLSMLVLYHERLEDADEGISKVIDKFQDFVVGVGIEIVREKRELSDDMFDKAGRIISRERIKKLREAVAVLTGLIDEAESRYSKSQEEIDDMEVKEIVEKLDKVSADVKSVVEEVGIIKDVLKNHKLLLTEEEKKKAEEAKIEAEKKAKEKAEADKVEAEKRKAELEKAEKDKIEAEKKAKEEADKVKVEAEKKLTDRFEKSEKRLEEVSKVVENIGKKIGVKTSIVKDSGDDTTEDPFGDALRK